MSELSGKTALVTGATAGIGRETALGLAKLGAQVILVGRSELKARQVTEQLRTLSGNQRIEFLVADLCLMAEVRKLAAEFESRFGTLHALVNNVGAMQLRRQMTAEGLELTFALNHLSPFLLTKLLLPALERGAPSRIVNVSSGAHRGASLDFEDLEARKSYFAYRVYGRSKLMNILFTRELARRTMDKRITANALHPGMVASDFMKKPGGVGFLGNIYMSIFGISCEQGARTSIYLASSPEVAHVTGRYFFKCKERSPSPEAQDDEAARRLWEISEQLTQSVAGGAAGSR